MYSLPSDETETELVWYIVTYPLSARSSTMPLVGVSREYGSSCCHGT